MGNTCDKPTATSDKGEKPVLVYWQLHGRSDFCQAMLFAGGISFELDDTTANNWPATKEDSPFGQLPYLKHGNFTIGQGGAINRYCARLAGIYPDDPVEASICDMYIEEVMDIFGELFKVCKVAFLLACRINVWIFFENHTQPAIEYLSPSAKASN